MKRIHPLQSTIIRCLGRGPMTVRDLADILSRDENVIRAALGHLCDRGEAVQNGVSTGKYPKQLFELVQCHPLNAQERA